MQEACCRREAIRALPIAMQLDGRQVDALRRIAVARRYPSGRMVIIQGEPAEAVYAVASGALAVYGSLSDGRRQVFGFLYAGDMLGIGAGTGTYAYSVDALSASELCRFARRRLESLCESDRAIRRALLTHATHELILAQERLLVLGRLSASERIASFLTSLHRRLANPGAADDIWLPMTRGDIGDYLGLSMETVSRVLSQLVRQGFIALPSPHHVILLDRAGLSAMACA